MQGPAMAFGITDFREAAWLDEDVLHKEVSGGWKESPEGPLSLSSHLNESHCQDSVHSNSYPSPTILLLLEVGMTSVFSSSSSSLPQVPF